MKTILVTGGAGFIGSNFINYVLKEKSNDVKIINYDLLTYAGNLENLKDVEDNDNYEFVKGNVTNTELLTHLISKHDVDGVVHFAAESHVDRSIENPNIFVESNISGTLSVLNACRTCWENSDGSYKENKRLIHVSTDEVYGDLEDDGSMFVESTPLNPHSPYSASKASSDMLVSSFIDTFKFPAIITRCSNNYGPYQFPEKLIPLIINNALKGKTLPVYGTGMNVRDWLYVDDHAKAILMALENGKLGEVYNVGGYNEKYNVDIVKIIIKSLHDFLPEGDVRKDHLNDDLIRFVEDRKGHDLRYAIDPTKIMNDLGWYPETKFEEGIVLTIKWYLNNLEWMENVTSGEYKNYYMNMYDKKGRN